MPRRWKLWFTPGTGCSICGSKDKGDVASPGFGSFQTWCGPCLVVGGRHDPPLATLRIYERRGWLEHSRLAFREQGLRIFY